MHNSESIEKPPIVGFCWDHSLHQYTSIFNFAVNLKLVTPLMSKCGHNFHSRYCNQTLKCYPMCKYTNTDLTYVTYTVIGFT